jgi:hypothetical protein
MDRVLVRVWTRHPRTMGCVLCVCLTCCQRNMPCVTFSSHIWLCCAVQCMMNVINSLPGNGVRAILPYIYAEAKEQAGQVGQDSLHL